jgi:hypothetical protein
MPLNHPQPRLDREKLSLSQRVGAFYRFLNREKFDRCLQYLDPVIQHPGFDSQVYQDQLSQFAKRYGPVTIKIRSYRFVSGQKVNTDRAMTSIEQKRDFAYVLLSWIDRDGILHEFRERWVKFEGKWYTRVAGVITPESCSDSD